MKQTGIKWLPEIAENFSVGFVKQYFNISKDLSNEGEPDKVLKLARSGIVEKDVTTNEGQMAASYEGYNKVETGDLLLNPMDLYSGANCNVSELKGVISPAYSNLRAKDKNTTCSKYYDYFFKTQYWTMAMFAHGKGVSFDNRWTLNNDSLKSYEIPVPPYEKQKAIVDAIESKTTKIDALISNEEKQIEKLKAYKQALITETVTKGLDKNVKMKDSGVEWIGEIPDSWEVIPFKTVFKLTKGLNITKANLVENGLPVISYGQIHAKYNATVYVKTEMLRYVPESYSENNESSFGKYGDIFITDTSEDYDGIGDCVRVNSKDGIYAGYHTILARPKESENSKYLSYLFMSDIWRNQLRRNAYGIKVYSVTQNMLKKIDVILPPKKEQEEIGNYLDSKCSYIDRLISIKESKIEKLNTYKKSLIYEYVTGKKEV